MNYSNSDESRTTDSNKVTTIVTGFLADQNSNRSQQKYIDLGLNLLRNHKLQIVCFIEEAVYLEHFNNEEFPNVRFLLFEKGDNYMTKLDTSQFKLDTDNPNKDTLGYMTTMCHKTEWIRTAIQENPFSTDQFIWVDFGIYHVIRDRERFYSAIEKASLQKYNRVRIASCRDPSNTIIPEDIYRRIAWYFAGGVFGGNTESLLKFAEKTKKKCIDIIESKKHIMWEVNVWYLVYKDYADLFEPYHSLHDISIIEAY